MRKVTFVFGPKGSGKSTLARQLAGIRDLALTHNADDFISQLCDHSFKPDLSVDSIIVEEVTRVDQIMWLLYSDKLVKREQSFGEIIKAPNLIFTSQKVLAPIKLPVTDVDIIRGIYVTILLYPLQYVQ